MLKDNKFYLVLNNVNAKFIFTYNAGINDAHNAKYRCYHVNTEIGDLREGNGRHIDDNGHVHEERNGEQHRGENSDRPCKSNFQVLKGAV